MNEITDEHTAALDIAGWKIVAKDEDAVGTTSRWTFNSRKAGGYKCPDWCDDISKSPRTKPDLHLVR